MKKILLFAPILLLGVFFLCGCSRNDYSSKKSNASDEDRALYQDALANKDENKCNDIKYYELEQQCYEKIAIKKGKSEICDKITKKTVRDYCLRDVAEKNKDPKICKEVKDKIHRSNCFSDVAKKLKQHSVCDKVEDLLIRDNCYAYLGSKGTEIEVCLKIKKDEGDKDDCIKNVAINSKNQELCYKISDPKRKQDCLDYLENK